MIKNVVVYTAIMLVGMTLLFIQRSPTTIMMSIPAQIHYEPLLLTSIALTIVLAGTILTYVKKKTKIQFTYVGIASFPFSISLYFVLLFFYHYPDGIFYFR